MRVRVHVRMRVRVHVHVHLVCFFLNLYVYRWNVVCVRPTESVSLECGLCTPYRECIFGMWCVYAVPRASQVGLSRVCVQTVCVQTHMAAAYRLAVARREVDRVTVGGGRGMQAPHTVQRTEDSSKVIPYMEGERRTARRSAPPSHAIIIALHSGTPVGMAFACGGRTEPRPPTTSRARLVAVAVNAPPIGLVVLMPSYTLM